MNFKTASACLAILICGATAAPASDDPIAVGEWRTESGKSLVCGGQEGDTIVEIATRANAFYESGAKTGSPEYEAYWSKLETAFQERRCFVTQGMRHVPDALIYSGPAALEAQGKRFKVIGTTIEEDGERYPAFTMTTRKIRQR